MVKRKTPASKDPGAQFNDGMFLLPDLPNPKDSYLIIVEPTGGGDAIQMTLPPGSTDLRVSKAALPSGAWPWKFKVSRQDVPGIKVATPRELALSSIDIPERRYPLAWNRVDGAKRYVSAGPVASGRSWPPTAHHEGQLHGIELGDLRC